MQCIFPHLYNIFLASIHNILWCKAVDHVAAVKDNQQKNHTEEQKSLWTSSLWSNFVQLKIRKKKYYSSNSIFVTSIFEVKLK